MLLFQCGSFLVGRAALEGESSFIFCSGCLKLTFTPRLLKTNVRKIHKIHRVFAVQILTCWFWTTLLFLDNFSLLLPPVLSQHLVCPAEVAVHFGTTQSTWALSFEPAQSITKSNTISALGPQTSAELISSKSSLQSFTQTLRS